MRNFLIYETLDDFYDVLYDKNDEKFKTFESLGLIKNYQYNISQVKYMNDFEHEYFTIMSVGEEPLVITGIIIDSHANRDTLKIIGYSLDDGLTWHNRANDNNKTENLNIIANPITLNYGERICIKGNAKTYFSSGFNSLTFEFDQSYESKFEVSGNIMSLFYEDDFYHRNFEIDSVDCLSGFFSEQKMLVSAENLILPSMFVPEYGYDSMFYECRNLLYAPKLLPAKILSKGCYTFMFYGCKRLIKGPDIKALQPFRDMIFPGRIGQMGIIGPGGENPYVGRKGKDRWVDSFYAMFIGCHNLHYIGCDLTNLSYIYYYETQSSVRPGWNTIRAVKAKIILFTDSWCDDEYYDTETEDTSYYASSNSTLISGYYNMFSKYGVFIKNRNAKYDNSQDISSIPKHWEIVYSDKKEYFFKPLTFKALENSTIFYFTKINTVSSDKLYYSLDEGKTWTQCNFINNVFTSPTLNNGDTISWKGNLTHPVVPQKQTHADVHVYYINGGIGSFKTNIVNNKYKNYDIYGNIESLVHDDEFIYGKGIKFKTVQNNVEQYVKGLFFNIFKLPTILENSGPINAENLILGAMDLSDHCYEYMFQNCTALQTAPELLAIKMAKWCYAGMFMECYSLPVVQKLPAEELAEGCYASMYDWCTSLTVIDKDMLPATEMKNRCYFGLFNGCSSLVSGPDLPATSLYIDQNPNPNTDKTYGWVYGHMFYNCSNLSVVPDLPATTLSEWCYAEMFAGCHGIVNAQSILPATTLAPQCYAAMFVNCQNLVSAPQLPATSLIKFCYQSMFEQCSSLTTAPELPATSLANACYAFMFRNCTNLNYIKAMFKSVSTNYNNYDEAGALSDWVLNVPSSGTFVKNSTATWSNDLEGIIPSGWTVQTSAS